MTTWLTMTGADGADFSVAHLPVVGARRGGLVLAQEIFGVTDAILATAGQYANAGFEVLVPSLFHRIERGFQAPVDPDGFQRGIAAVQATPWDQVAGDLQACVDHLRGAGPVFLTGFCWGGAVAWLGAARCEGVAASSAFYGRMINDLLNDAPKTPIILHYGKRDASISGDRVMAVKARFPLVPVYLYDAGHGFCRLGHHDFDQAVCDLAFARTVAHFVQHSDQVGP